MLSKVDVDRQVALAGQRVGHLTATRGFIAFRRSSKLSTSISRNLRSADRRQRLGLALARQVGQHAHHEGQLHLLLGAVVSTSYSICTRGARLRAMNFWLLSLPTIACGAAGV
jgi:hypothetical protein